MPLHTDTLRTCDLDDRPQPAVVDPRETQFVQTVALMQYRRLRVTMTPAEIVALLDGETVPALEAVPHGR